MPTQEQIEQGAGMADYADLLARLSVRQAIRVGKDGLPAISLQEVSDLCAECAAAIRALLAERDAAVLAEREACAKVCDNKAAFKATLIMGSGTRWREAVAAEAASLSLAAAIRARSNG